MRQGRSLRSRELLVAAVLVALFGLASLLATLANSPGTEAARLKDGDDPDHLTISLGPVGGWETSGKATLRPEDGVTTVAIRLTTASRGAFPAQIHRGTCQAFDPMPGVPLADAEPGLPTRTVVEIPLAELLAGSYVINIHQPSTNLASLLDPAGVVACGAIASSRSTATQPPVTGIGSAIVDDRYGALSVGLTAAALMLAGAGFAVRRSERRALLPHAR
ncbi:MAG: hypothetical protein QOF01_777 [Thermomicrobiales bacterium]|nr:hypothetical protein [Thermomicrobiales bacterium]